MYHGRFKGTHYEIGFKWGTLLRKHGNFILNNVGFPLTEERMKFADLCVPVYQKYFPEILEEIRGIADGQKICVEKLHALLFSMYAIPPSCGCSCFAISDNGRIILGRNSDFLTEYEKTNMNVIYSFSSSSYSFTGNTTAFVQIEDGINQHGLAAGLTSVRPSKIKPGLNAGLLLRYFLEKCKTVQEVTDCIKTLPVSSAQTFTVADKNGDIAVIECCSEKSEVIRPVSGKNFVCAVNSFSSESMSEYNIGTDNWNSAQRRHTMTACMNQETVVADFSHVARLLAGKYGFICQYDRSTGKDTVWSVIYDISDKAIYRAEGNPSRRKFKKDTRFNIL